MCLVVMKKMTIKADLEFDLVTFVGICRRYFDGGRICLNVIVKFD